MLFSVPKMSFSFFRAALEPEILGSHIRTGNCCRVVVIMYLSERTRRVLFGASESIRTTISGEKNIRIRGKCVVFVSYRSSKLRWRHDTVIMR